jgi:hypothetical protein
MDDVFPHCGTEGTCRDDCQWPDAPCPRLSPPPRPVITVEKGIPMPSRLSRRGPKRGEGGRNPQMVYPWHDMEIGDSFEFPFEMSRNAYRAAANASRHGKIFEVLRFNGRYRCWRTA